MPECFKCSGLDPKCGCFQRPSDTAAAVAVASVVKKIVKELRARAVDYDKPWFLGEAHSLREAADRIEAEYLHSTEETR